MTTIAAIQAAVVEHYGLRPLDMVSERRGRNEARPRQIAMYLARELTAFSLPNIGRKFDKHHTTVMHAIETIGRLRERDEAIADAINTIVEKLNQR